MVGVGVCCVRGGLFVVGGVCVVLGWDICALLKHHSRNVFLQAFPSLV